VTEFKKVAKLSQLPEGELLAVELGGESVLLVNVGGEIKAVSETCPHEEAPLSEGYLDDGTLECPWHSSIFDLATGEVLEGPSLEDLKTYPVHIEGDDVLLGPAQE